MARILLISLNTETQPYPVYPLGMAVVAASLSEAGYDVRQYDLLASNGGRETPLEQAIAGAVDTARDFAPELIGVSVRNIDNVDIFSGLDHWYLANLKALTGALKDAIGVPVLLGGPGFSIMPEAILDYTGADAGVVGRGEEAMPALCHAMLNGGTKERLWRSDKSVFNDMAFAPKVDEALMDYYAAESGMANIQSKWGCPYSCVYCTYPHIEGPRFRYRDVNRVLDEIRGLNERFGVGHFVFTDSVFNDGREQYLDLVHALTEAREGGLDIRWSAFFRPADIDAERVRLLKRSGLCAVELGTDAGCDTTLKALGKNFTMDEVRRVNDAFMGEGVPTAHFMILGGPQESMDTLAESVDNIKSLDATVFFPFVGIRILPGTPLHTLAVEQGVVEAADELLKPVYYTPPDLPFETIDEFLSRELKPIANCFYPPSEGELRMEIMHRFGHRGLLWDRMLTRKGGRNAA